MAITRLWKCAICGLSQAYYLFAKIVNEKKKLGLCDKCKDKPWPPKKRKRPEDKRITALKNGKKVKL